MSAVFLKVLQMSAAAGCMILAAVLLRPALRKAPKWISCLLWGLVGIRLANPFSVRSAFSLLPRGAWLSFGAAQPAAAGTGSGAPALSFALPQASGARAQTADILLWAGTAIWLAGVFAMLLYALAGFLRLKKTVAAAAPAPGGVLTCDAIETPFLLGLFRPRIYVPAALSAETLACVAAHETAHFRRGDQFWKPLGYLLLAVHWFNPLCWLSYVLLCRDIEAACDERVIRGKTKAEIAAYSRALLACSCKKTGIAACPLAFGEVGTRQRIERILAYKKPAFWAVPAAGVLCLALCLCLLTDPLPAATAVPAPKEHAQAAPETAPTAPAPWAAAPERTPEPAPAETATKAAPAQSADTPARPADRPVPARSEAAAVLPEASAARAAEQDAAGPAAAEEPTAPAAEHQTPAAEAPSQAPGQPGADTISPPASAFAPDDPAENAVSFIRNSGTSGDAPGQYTVVEGTGTGKVTLRGEDGAYTVYSEKDGSGRWRVTSYEYHADAAAQGGDAPAPSEGE